MRPYKILVIDQTTVLLENQSLRIESNACEMDVISSTEEALKKDISQYNLLLVGYEKGIATNLSSTKELHRKTNLGGIPIIAFTHAQLKSKHSDSSAIGAEQYMELWREIGFDL